MSCTEGGEGVLQKLIFDDGGGVLQKVFFVDEGVKQKVILHDEGERAWPNKLYYRYIGQLWWQTHKIPSLNANVYT